SMVCAPFDFPTDAPQNTIFERTAGADATGYLSKREALGRVLSLALFDYLRKSHSKGFVVSLSGGADSAAVALLVRLMVRLAVDELGIPETMARLPFLE